MRTSVSQTVTNGHELEAELYLVEVHYNLHRSSFWRKGEEAHCLHGSTCRNLQNFKASDITGDRSWTWD